MKRKIFGILFALVLALSLLLVAAPAALAWQEGPGTDWWFINACMVGGNYYSTVPPVIEINGNPADWQLFPMGTTVTITGDLRAYAASCAGAHGPPQNEAYIEWHLEVTGASGPADDNGSDTNYNSPDCAELEVITTPSITYDLTAPGIHTIYMSSYAKVSQYGSKVADETVDASINFVVYDPTGGEGHVTGGGWINSPEGAYVPVTTLAGKATFGFVAKYKKGAVVPDGQTEFQFKVGDLNFHSTAYQWLVVNQGGTNAQFKGTGTINGMGEYKFMLWAGDGEPDTFRIKIWTENGGETVIYDNGMQQSIAGGSIIVHKK